MKKKALIYGLTAISLLSLTACGNDNSKKDDKKEDKQEEVAKKENQDLIQAKKEIEKKHFNQAKKLLKSITDKKEDHDKKVAEHLITQIDDYQKTNQYFQAGQWQEAKTEADKVTKEKNGSTYLVNKAKTIIKACDEQEALIKTTNDEKNALYNAQEDINQQNFYAAKDQLAIAKKDDQLTSEAEQMEAQIDHYLSAQTALNEQQFTKAKNEAEAVIDTDNGSSQMQVYARDILDEVISRQEQNEAIQLNKEAKKALAIAKDDIIQGDFQSALYELNLAEKDNHDKMEASHIKAQLNHYLTAYSAYRYGKYSEAKNEITAIKEETDGDTTLITYANHLLVLVKQDEKVAKAEKTEALKASEALTRAKDNIIHQNFYMAQKELDVAMKDSAYTKEAKAMKAQIENYLKAYDRFDKGEYKQAIKEAKKVRHSQDGDSQLFAYADQLIHDCQVKLETK